MKKVNIGTDLKQTYTDAMKHAVRDYTGADPRPVLKHISEAIIEKVSHHVALLNTPSSTENVHAA